MYILLILQMYKITCSCYFAVEASDLLETEVMVRSWYDSPIPNNRVDREKHRQVQSLQACRSNEFGVLGV